MARDTRTRLTRPGSGAISAPTHRSTRADTPSIAGLLARAVRPGDLLSQLHQHALETTGGRCSALLEYNPRTGALQLTSASDIHVIRAGPWLADPGEADLVAAALKSPADTILLHPDRDVPALASRLASASVLLLPLARGRERVGVLAVGFRYPPPADHAFGSCSGLVDAFLFGVELTRLRRRDRARGDIRTLIGEFGSISSTINLTAGFELVCRGAKRLLGASRASVWLHDRRGRHLVLRASSDAAYGAASGRVSTDDPFSPAVIAMRSEHSDVLPASQEEAGPTITVPLRGWRRALGTMVLEDVHVEPGGELELLDRADELGHQLSSAIESMQLLDDVMRSRRELENTFDSLGELVAVADRRGRIVHVNHAFASRVDTSREALVGRPLVDYLGPDLRSWLTDIDRRNTGSQSSEASTREVIDPVLNGAFLATITDLLDKSRERVGSVLVARDLAAQTRIDAEREELRKRLTQTEKLAALGQFVAGIAHELNNPLQGVLGHLELLRTTGAFPKQLRREVQTIYREADRAAKIVRNLMVFAGSRRLARRPVSLNAILQKVVTLRASACRAADVEVVRHYDDKLPRVQSDPLLLHQAFFNVLMNAEQAVMATGRAGRIEITTALARSGRIVATVRDSGSGIAPDVLPRIFEPFFTTKEVGQGTGLGLAIAYGIVQEHGGQITAANHPDGGAVLTVELPAMLATARTP